MAVLDANVLVDACLRDTLLRMAEEPRLYRPRWSELIIDELKGVLGKRRGLSQERIAYLIGQLREHFPEAWVKIPISPHTVSSASNFVQR